MAEAVQDSLLKKTLSLSKNGGIYYGGARVKPDEKSAVLFVGLGGSGADALIRVKDQIKTRMILPSDKTGAPIADAPKTIGFLEIDTDETVQGITYGTARFDSFGNEFCDISVKSVPDVIADIQKAKKSGVECWQWFDDDINQISGAKGAGGVRQIGRMLLANNIQKVISNVEGKISSLTVDNPDINNLLIYIFSGISGGTGAGIFLDMAYILKKIAKSKIPSVNTMGYLIMTDVNELNGGKTESLRTNGFSCLKELDYWMSSGEHKERYHQKFPNGFELNELAAPFDFCHLLDASDAEGHQFNYDKILRTVAETSFTYVTGEVDGGEGGNSTMAQMYNNIKGYITTITGTADYPACYDYLSLGSSKIEIPYTEISTLVAARVFERLEKGMFANRPTENLFNATVYRDLEMTEENIRSALYKNVNVPRPMLSAGNYKYADVWPNNAPYQAVNSWLALFQRSVVAQAGNLPGYLEGKLKEFIRSNLRDYHTGPIYLRYFMKSEQTYCLYHMLEAFRKYCRQLQAQCSGKSKDLREAMQQAYAEGSSLAFGGSKSRALKRYMDCLDAWYQNEEHAFLNGKIADILETLQKRIVLYFENILRPLSDVLMELPKIFTENVEYIRVNETKVDEGTDILIRPLEFEKTRKIEFDAAVANAEKQFLDSLSENIHKWIGRDIDGVDENISTSADVAGFISTFISENFATLLTINMEAIMNTKLNDGESLEDYVKNRVDDLIKKSFPMYKETTGLTGSVEQFSILSVPRDCPTIYKVAKEHIEAKNLKKLISVKKSDEKSRLYIIKVASGYPLYSNAFLQGMEEAYEEQMGNLATSMGKHLKPEWCTRFPSPLIELAWKEPYVCKRTKERNEKYREYFNRCFHNKIIVKKEDGTFWLRRARKEITVTVSKASLTAPTILGKMEQFEKMKAKLWEDGDSMKIPSCSKYKRGQESGDLENVRENILRFPGMLEALADECELADKIERIDEELHYPKYFALANINHMIYINKITGDTLYRRTENDPFPVKLTKGQEMHPDFKDYQIFESFCKVIHEDMKEEIDLQYDNLKNRIESSEKALNEYVTEIKERMESYKNQEEKARNDMYYASKEDRPAFLKKIEFYQGVVEEMKRMLPIGEDVERRNENTAAVQPATNTAPVTPPKYLDPQTWQPIANPQPGQMVFDTETKQMTAYQPAVQPAAPIRYLDPQTWQPVMNPQPGQMVFDTELKQMIAYQPETPRYLDSQTWQPVMNPQPGQMVFDTKTSQMITYYPGQF